MASETNAFDFSRLFDVSGKSVVVTGGTRGIGYMIARGFAAAGAEVVISARKVAECEEAARSLSEIGSCVACPADLSTDEGIDTLAAFVADRGRGLDVLVNNAGATWGAPVDDFPASGFDKVFDLNVRSLFLLTQKLLPQLRNAASDDDPARVINIGSIDGLVVSATENFSYGASKAAVHMLTRKLAATLAGERITVNAIAPGLFPSKMTQFMLDDPEVSEAIAARIPLGRIGTPGDVAGAAIFLSSRAGAFVTGTILPIDGGSSGTA